MPPRPAGRTAARKTDKTEKTVTRAFLFSDLRDYTDFVETKGDAAAAALLRDYRRIVRAAVGAGGGAEVKTEGDSFYVVFESALAALECAVAIQREVLRHNESSGMPIRIGVGLHVGETVPYDDQFVGGAVNVAARLTSKAKAGEIVVSDTFRGLVRTGQRYPMEDLGPQRLKGVTERLRAWKVQWRETAADAPASAPPVAMPLLSRSEPVVPRPVPGQLVCPVVVGRTAERARFAEHLAHAREGRGQTVLLSGEAGVGKSAFTRQCIEAATAQGFRVLYGVTVESDGGLPYAPFVAAVRSGFRGIDRDRLGRVLAQTAPDLAQLFPELSKASRAEPATTVEQHRLSVAFQGLFSAFARETPVLLVVEDLHWCDEASLSLLHYLARELRDTRVLLLGTYRSDEMHRRHPLLRVLAGMQRERLVGEIALGKLTPDEVRELIHATLLPTDPDISVGDELRDALYARSEGNPFFTEELIKSLVESGDLFHREGTGWERKPIDQMKIPGSVREAVRARVEKLSPEAQATLSAAAAIGLRFSFDLLREMRAIGEPELESQLREAIDQQLIVELGGQSDEYGFRHALTKEVVYDDLMVRERKRLHRAVADALAANEHAEPALVAHHLIAAADNAAAVPFLLEAAKRAHRAFAPRDAAAHFEKAIEIGLPPDQVAAALESLADTYYLFDFARSRKAAEEAAQVYRQRGDVRGLSRMLRLASRNAWQQGDPTRAAAFAQEAIDALVGLEDTMELGRALVNLGTLRMLGGADEDALSLSERALAIGERFADAWTTANALITQGTVGMRHDTEGSRASMLRGLELAKAADLAEVALRGYNNLIIRMDDPVERDRLLEEGIAYGAGHGLQQPMLLANRAFTAYIRGEWDSALVDAERVPEGSVWHDSMALAARSGVALGRDGPDGALALMRPGAEAAIRHSEAQRVLGPVLMMMFLAAVGDRRDEAARWADLLMQRVSADPRVGRHLAGGGYFNPLMPAAAYLGQPEWLDLIDHNVIAPDLQPQFRPLQLAGRAYFSRDAEACADATAEYNRATESRWGVNPTGYVFARELARQGVPLGEGWRSVLVTHRRYLEGARAGWLLGELAKVEEQVAAG